MIDWKAIAARIDTLAHDLDVSSHTLAAPVAALAGRDLRHRLETGSPAETVERLVSVVRLYGVDPTWLICGWFNDETHRTVLDGSFRETWWLVQRLLIEQSGTPPKELRLRL